MIRERVDPPWATAGVRLLRDAEMRCLPEGEEDAMKPHVFVASMLVVGLALLTGVPLAATPPTPNLGDRLAAMEATV